MLRYFVGRRDLLRLWCIQYLVRPSFFHQKLLTITLKHFSHSTDDEFHNYMRDNFFPGSSDEEVAPLLTLYPNEPALGSPFGTGDENQFAPMNKRVAAFQGDFFFQSARRSLLMQRSDKQPAWTYSAYLAPPRLASNLSSNSHRLQW